MPRLKLYRNPTIILRPPGRDRRAWMFTLQHFDGRSQSVTAPGRDAAADSAGDALVPPRDDGPDPIRRAVDDAWRDLTLGQVHARR